MRPLTPILAFVTLALFVAGGVHNWAELPASSAKHEPGRSEHSRPAATINSAPPQSNEQHVVELAVQYLERYGETITDPATQARLYNERRNVIERYPDSGETLFQLAITTAFPDQADAIFALIANLDHYNLWLDENELRLQGLPEMDRYAELWQQRDALFGPLASRIWADEPNPVDAQSNQFQQALAQLDQAGEIPLSELAYQLQATADELYGVDLARQLAGAGAIGHALFAMDSVQQQLARLPPDERQQAMNSLRRQIGYSEERILELAEEDQRREEKWREGKAYMSERHALEKRLSGDQLEAALTKLRQEHFGFSAPTIKREEDEGFFRFERERRYGLN